MRIELTLFTGLQSVAFPFGHLAIKIGFAGRNLTCDIPLHLGAFFIEKPFKGIAPVNDDDIVGDCYSSLSYLSTGQT